MSTNNVKTVCYICKHEPALCPGHFDLRLHLKPFQKLGAASAYRVGKAIAHAEKLAIPADPPKPAVNSHSQPIVI